jgi:hypothetical protein
MKRHMNTHNRERGENTTASVTVAATPDGSGGASLDVGELAEEVAGLPEEAVVITEESLSQPMNLNMTVPASSDQPEEATPEQIAAAAAADQTIGQEEVYENGIPHSRDPLETVRGENGNTLYVWPIYMG